MAKQYLTVNGQLVMHNGKLIQVPDPDGINDLLDEQDGYATQLQQLSDDVSNLALNGLVDGTPRGSFQTLELLQSAYPDGTPGIYVITKTGEWCYYNEGWKIGGNYIEPDSGGGASITANIKITGNKDDILGTTEHNKLCILSDTGDLSFKVSNKFIKDSLEFQSNSNGHKITISNAYSNYYNNAMIDYGSFYGYFGWIAIFCEDINKIFVAYSNNNNNSLGTKCYLYDISTNSWEDIYNASDGSSFTKQSFYYKNKIYCKKNKAFNLKTKQMEDTNFNINISEKIYNASNRAIVSGNLIYYVNSSKLTIYDVESDTINELALTKSINSYPAYSYARCIYGDYIYICGTTWYNQPQNKFFKINIHNGEVTNLAEIPISMDKACGCNIGNKFYVSQAGTNKIYIFNLDTETWEDNTLTNLGANANAVGEILTDGNKLFFINNITDSCYVVTYNFTGGTLPTNEVYIYTSNDSDYSFDLITDQVTIPIKNIYIGDSNNTAQLANAYLYSETQAGWVNVNTGEVLS